MLFPRSLEKMDGSQKVAILNKREWGTGDTIINHFSDSSENVKIINTDI